jgi:hypothetical protein
MAFTALARLRKSEPGRFRARVALDQQSRGQLCERRLYLLPPQWGTARDRAIDRQALRRDRLSINTDPHEAVLVRHDGRNNVIGILKTRRVGPTATGVPRDSSVASRNSAWDSPASQRQIGRSIGLAWRTPEEIRTLDPRFVRSGSKHEVAALQPAARGQEPRGR